MLGPWESIVYCLERGTAKLAWKPVPNASIAMAVQHNFQKGGGIKLILVVNVSCIENLAMHVHGYHNIYFYLLQCNCSQYRSREPNSRYDRYMLVSFDEPPNCIKVYATVHYFNVACNRDTYLHTHWTSFVALVMIDH